MPAIAVACSNIVTDHLIIVSCALDPAQQNGSLVIRECMHFFTSGGSVYGKED